MTSYCSIAGGHEWHGPYHDREYGFPLTGDAELFERLVLEINQAGLSWLTILKKRDAFRRAFDGFVPTWWPATARPSASGSSVTRASCATASRWTPRVENARRVVALRAQYGDLAGWLAAHHPRSKEEWVRLFRQTFRFVGGEIVGEFLMSIGYLPGAHEPDCPVYRRIAPLRPPWMAAR